MIRDIQDKIADIKKEKDICILAHSYQNRDIVEVADLVGDSFALSVKAADLPHKTVVMCGVRFMAETVKILSPDKTVILANSDAGCLMADQMNKTMIEQWRKEHPDYAVVAYINTTSELKTVCDVCVTSSSAVTIVKAIPQKNILFIPDCNLGAYVKEQVSEKNIVLLDGGCPIHAAVPESCAVQAKAAHPQAKLLVHPECRACVVKHADYVGSTKGIMDYAMASDAKEFIIGTENSIAEHLQHACPDKKFYLLSKNLICADMRATTLHDLLAAVEGTGGEVMQLSDEVMVGARRCIDAMIALG